MTDELDLDLDLEADEPEINRTQKRIKDLSEKVKTKAQEVDAAAQATAEAEQRAVNAEKERDFYASFSDSIAKYPAAAEFKDAIKEKVMAGYSVEDASVAILAKEGKFNQPHTESQREMAAGGSAVFTPPAGGEKKISDMSQSERRQALLDAEARGDIALT